jgi:Cu-Zn family superoxide dismutase
VVKRAIGYVHAVGEGDLYGTATFVREGEQITAHVRLEGAPPGLHTVRIHTIGDCSAQDGSSTGEPWEGGEIGDILIAADGGGTLTRASTGWRMGGRGDADLIGRAVVVYAGPASGGARIGCGVIR